MNSRQWRMMALLLSVLAVTAIIAPASLAYIAGVSNTLVNVFTVQNDTPVAAEAQIEISKIIRSEGASTISPQGFAFVLENTETGEQQTLVSDAAGKASGTLRVTAAGTQVYRLYERNDARKYVSYSTDVHEVVVQAAVEQSNQIGLDITIDGNTAEKIAASFVNLYSPVDVPFTGDSTPLMAYTLLAGISMALLMTLGWRRRKV